jgi:hypothetical protein
MVARALSLSSRKTDPHALTVCIHDRAELIKESEGRSTEGGQQGAHAESARDEVLLLLLCHISELISATQIRNVFVVQS